MFIIKIKSLNFVKSREALGLMRKICAGLLLFTCVLPAFIAAQKNKFTGTPPKFGREYFRRLTNKPEIATIPFTAEEFIKFAPEKITSRIVVRPAQGKFPVLKPGEFPVLKTDRQQMITITKRTKYKGVESSQTVQVPLDDYVAEINKYEAFLNQFGETLRDGKFSKTNPNARVRSNLGVLFALRDRSQIKDPSVNKPNEVFYDPNRFSRWIPHDPGGILRPDQRIKTLPNISTLPNVSTNPVSTGILNVNPQINAKDFVLSRSGNRFLIANGLIRKIGIGLDKSYGGQILMFANSGTAPQSGCVTKSKPEFKTLIEGDTSCGGGASNTLTAQTPGTCPGDEPSEDDPKCLYDGEIETKTYNFASIEYDSNGGGNGWFGGFANFNLISSTFLLPEQSQKKTLGLNNKGIGNIGIELLGSRIDLIRAEHEVSWKTGMSAPEISGGDPVVLPQIFGDNFTINSDFHQEVDGPGTFFMVGPVPISITSRFEVTAGFSKQQPFIPIPDTCNGQGGSLKMFMGPNAKASVYLRAAIDAVVASAGIEGELVLTDDQFGASLETLVSPSDNRITFKPELGYKFKHLAGHLYLFVELDLGIYSKKWSIEIIGFDGFEKSGTLLPTAPLVISSKKKK